MPTPPATPRPCCAPFITHVAIRRGELLGAYRKVTIKDGEDAWYESVFATCRLKGAQIVFELAAPGLYGDQATRDWESGYLWWEEKCRDQLGAYARTHNLWIAVATQAGRTLDEDFPGGGYLCAPDGTRVYATEHWSPGVVYLDLNFAQGQAAQL